MTIDWQRLKFKTLKMIEKILVKKLNLDKYFILSSEIHLWSNKILELK